MSIYEMVSERILQELEKGTIPWRKPWGEIGPPQNYISKKAYRGINILLLGCARVSRPFWMTFRQVKELGGRVKQGASAFPVVYFAWKEKALGNGKQDTYPVLRYYKVFNADQVEDIAFPELARREIHPILECEKILAAMPRRPVIEHKEPQAYYSPARDFVNMPVQGLFHDDQGYYATLFHELSHSTGHPTRLNRRKQDGVDCRFGSAPYAQEELVAEMSAAFLCAHAGIENLTLDNHAAYIANWLTVLRQDKRMLVMSAAQAQKATDYILGTLSVKAETEVRTSEGESHVA